MMLLVAVVCAVLSATAARADGDLLTSFNHDNGRMSGEQGSRSSGRKVFLSNPTWGSHITVKIIVIFHRMLVAEDNRILL